jgi:hypothetical protein
MKLNEVGKAQEVALRLENYVERFKLTPESSLALSTVGYANKLIGNKQKYWRSTQDIYRSQKHWKACV